MLLGHGVQHLVRGEGCCLLPTLVYQVLIMHDLMEHHLLGTVRLGVEVQASSSHRSLCSQAAAGLVVNGRYGCPEPKERKGWGKAPLRASNKTGLDRGHFPPSA